MVFFSKESSITKRESGYLLLVGLVLAINLLPAFAPPTWAILVFYKLNSDMNTGAIIVLGVLASSTGRYLLALGVRSLRHKLKPDYLANLARVQSYIGGHGKGIVLYFLFFMISPLPSAQIFEAAALMNAPLIRITLMFMIGRGISYSISVLGASTLKAHAMSTVLINSIKSPWGIAIQIISLIGIYALLKVDWMKYLPVKVTTVI